MSAELVVVFNEVVQGIRDAVSDSSAEPDTEAMTITRESEALAQTLDEMAKAIATNDKKGLVNGARNVTDVCKRLTDSANRISAKLKDRSDQEKIISAVTTVRKCGTDLKVQCAMLAASTSSDKTSGIESVMRTLLESLVSLIDRAGFASMAWNSV